MDIKQLKKELGIKNKDIVRMFGYKNELSYRNSSAKKRIERGLCSLYEVFKAKNK